MSGLNQQSADPAHIAVSRSGGIKVDWEDGHRSEYGLQHLRNHCPCATCAGTHENEPRKAGDSSPFELYKPKLKMVDVSPVGNYALQIKWNDGHSTGIYSFSYLRQICPCQECVKKSVR
jgi:DUF971 family protein